MEIRRAEIGDLPAITDIYNAAVFKTTATFDTEPQTLAAQKVWFDDHGADYPLLVCIQDTQLVGWAALSSWSDRCSYKTTGEVSVYVGEDQRGQGLGGQLLGALVAAGRAAGIHLAVARIVEGNPASIAIHQKHGFKISGKMSEAGFKFGKYLDVIFMEQLLDGSKKEIEIK